MRTKRDGPDVAPTWAAARDIYNMSCWDQKWAFHQIANALWAQHAFGSDKAARRAANLYFDMAIEAGIVLQ